MLTRIYPVGQVDGEGDDVTFELAKLAGMQAEQNPNILELLWTDRENIHIYAPGQAGEVGKPSALVFCVALVGIPVVAILMIGAALALKTGHVGSLKVTTRLIQALALAAGVFCAYTAFSHENEAEQTLGNLERYSASFQYPELLSLSYQQIRNKCPDQDYCQQAGIVMEYRNRVDGFTSRARYARHERNEMLMGTGAALVACMVLSFGWLGPASRKVGPLRAYLASKSQRADIIGRDKLASFSTAEELQRWVKLKEDGHITEEEYQNARRRLLGAS